MSRAVLSARSVGALWLLCCLAVAWQVGQRLQQGAVVTDLFALLPEQSERLPVAALERALRAGQDQVVVLVGHADPETARSASDALSASIAEQLPALQPERQSARWLGAAIDFYTRHREVLLTPAQAEHLRQEAPSSLAEAALRRLLQPGQVELLGDWRRDPLGLAADWLRWMARTSGGDSAAFEQGKVVKGLTWRAVGYRYARGGFVLDGGGRLTRGLALLAEGARARHPGLEVLYAGVPLHADSAAAQANREMSTIGLGSVLAVVVLVWTVFRSVRPLLLVSASLLIGILFGLWATLMLFGQVHVLTLVFGASLVGVAVDYGIHYFAARQAHPDASAQQCLARIRPSLLLALATSTMAYAVLGALPFPGLRQMAAFSACGLAAAFFSVTGLFPWLDRRAPRPTRLAQRVGRSLHRFPQLSMRGALLLTLILLTLAAWPLSTLRVSDDLRQLHGSPPILQSMQQQAGQILDLASPAQSFVLRADSAEALLAAERALGRALAPLARTGVLSGWSALGSWLPDAQQQAEHRRLRSMAESAAFAAATSLAGMEPLDEPPSAALDLAGFLQSALAAQMPQVVAGRDADGWYSLVALRGIAGTAALPALRDVARSLPRVEFIDRTADYAQLLAGYRERMSLLLLAGYLIVALALFWRFGRQGWRALLPTALASVIALAGLGAMGEPVYLFNVLALILLLGIGVDYGIFLFEHADEAAWLAVVMGAASTLLAFGLLGLSTTPALRAFGLTLLFGIAAVWLISPLFRPLPPSTRNP